MDCVYTAPQGLLPALVTASQSSLLFSWEPPSAPNGVILYYTLLVDSKLIYNGTNTQYR